MQQIVQFVKDTFQEETVPDTSVSGIVSGRCSVEKLHNKSNYIGEVILFDEKWEIEAKEELTDLLQKVLNEKTHKLRNVVDEKILLVLDAFHYVDSEAWKEAITVLHAYNNFHTVCRVMTNGGVQILFSRNTKLLSTNQT